MVTRKRTREEVPIPEDAPEQTLLQKLRNMWQFASLMQFIYIFGDALKIDRDFDIDVRNLHISMCSVRVLYQSTS
jgi:hypothetical protein